MRTVITHINYNNLSNALHYASNTFYNLDLCIIFYSFSILENIILYNIHIKMLSNIVALISGPIYGNIILCISIII